MKICILTLFIFLGSTVNAKTSDDNQLWLNTNTSGKISENILAYGEFQPRLMNDWNQLNSILYRMGLGFNFKPDWSLWAGYALVHMNYPNHYLESRPYLQSSYTFNLSQLSIINRSRIESRNFEDHPKTGIRFRHMLRGTYLFEETKQLYLVLWDEIFYNFNTVPGINHEGFDQNRIFLGLGHKFGEKLRHFIEGGYLNQHVVRYKKVNASNHALTFQYTFNF